LSQKKRSEKLVKPILTKKEEVGRSAANEGLFSAIGALIILAVAENMAYILCKWCGDYRAGFISTSRKNGQLFAGILGASPRF